MQIHDWLTLLFVLIAWVGSLGVIYGVIRARLDIYREVLKRHEQELDKRVRYEEYNRRHDDIQRHLTRIEEKLDRLVAARGPNKHQ